MNMNKALQNLYHAVSNETTTKVNISKLLVDIHYAITGKESANKNNWSKIVNSMADNWPEGGGGSSDFSTATVTVVGGDLNVAIPIVVTTEQGAPFDALVSMMQNIPSGAQVPLYNGHLIIQITQDIVAVSGNIESFGAGVYNVTGDCTITIS